MPPLLLDTDTVTFIADSNPVALHHLHSVGEAERLTTCFIVVGEWEYGIRNAIGVGRQEALRIAGDLIFDSMSEIWDSSRDIAIAYGEIHAYLRKSRGLDCCLTANSGVCLEKADWAKKSRAAEIGWSANLSRFE